MRVSVCKNVLPHGFICSLTICFCINTPPVWAVSPSPAGGNYLVLYAVAGMWQEDFEDGNYNGWEVKWRGGPIENEEWLNSPDFWNVKKGEVVCGSGTDRMTWLEYGDVNWSDYEVACDVKVIEPRPLGNLSIVFIVVRSIDAPTPAHMEFGFLKWHQGGPSLVFSEVIVGHIEMLLKGGAGPFWRFGKWYRLKVIASGKKFKFYIDNAPVLELTNSKVARGKIGIGLMGCLAHFDNVTVSGDEVHAVYAVNPQGHLVTTWASIKSDGH